jgi:hypothetical protein
MPSIKKFSKKSFKKRQNITKNKKTSGGGRNNNPNTSRRELAIKKAINIDKLNENEQNDLLQEVMRKIKGGHNPFDNEGFITIDEINYDTYQRTEIKYTNLDAFKEYTNVRGQTMDLMLLPCTEGYVSSFISLIDLYYPNHTIPSEILYKLYFYSLFWRYGDMNNDVCIYLLTFYKDKLDVKITDELLSSFTYLDKPTKNIIGDILKDNKDLNLSDLVDYYSHFGFKSYEIKESIKLSRNQSNNNITRALTKATTMIELKKIYKELVLKYHPDKYKPGPGEEKDAGHKKFIKLLDIFEKQMSKFKQ